MSKTTAMPISAAEPNYTPHPYALLLPPMSDEERAGHQADIKQHGLLEKIVINRKNQILDGVHRYRACIAVGTSPQFEVRDLTDAEVLTFVISRNLHRRHLDTSQRAAIAAEIANLKQGGTQPANLPDAISQGKAAKLMNVSERTTRTAVKVKDTSSALHAAVKAGKMSVHAAENVCDLPAAQRDQAIEQIKRGGARATAKPAKSSDGKKSAPAASAQQPNKKLHAAYASLIEELDRVPRLLADYPLSPEHLEQLNAELKRALVLVIKARHPKEVARKE